MILTRCPHCQTENPETAQYCAECGILLEPAGKAGPAQPRHVPSPREGLVIGSTFAQRYKIRAELGQGSLGKVYRALDMSLEREIVLKLLKPEISSDRQNLERFSQELKTARKIVHKNVARMFDFSEAEGTSCITTEYVEGQDLKTLIREKKIPKIDQTVALAMQVCEGLAQAHKLGAVHGALNPSAIAVDKEGTARILDFGIARAFFTKGFSEAGSPAGPPEYMSPERVEGRAIDQRSDVYSLGIILFEMVTGRVPFEGATPAIIAMKHKNEIPRIPRELAAFIPEDLSSLILKCLEKDKEKRYQTAEGLYADLEKLGKPIPPKETVKPKERAISTPGKAAPQEVKPDIKEEKKEAVPQKAPQKYDIKRLLLPASAGLAVVILGIVFWVFVLKPSKAAAPTQAGAEKKSVAILPFEDLSPAKDHEYLGDGLAETLIDTLAGIDGLWVPARNSSFSFKGKTRNSSEVGQKLGVEHVLEGSIRVVQEELLITAKLIRVKDGAPVWSNQYDRNKEDIFALQEEIGRAVIKALAFKLPAEKAGYLIMDSTKNVAAYDLYLQGRFLWNKGGKTNLEQAVEYFQKAAEKDSGYALAYVGLADAYTVLGSNFNWPSEPTFTKARLATVKALELAPNLAEAHTTLGVIKANLDWDFAAAEREFKEAIRLKPNYVLARQWYAVFLSNQGRHDKAFSEIRLCQKLDPLSPGIDANVGALLYFARQYDQAVQELRQAAKRNPSYFVNYYYLGLIYIQVDQKEEAIKSFERAEELGGEPLDMSLRRAYVYALQGRRREVGRILTEAIRVSSQAYVSEVSIATVYAALGEKEQVFACLDKAFTARDSKLVFLKVHPMFDSVRRDLRFARLLQKIGLEK
jgi:serine/threonine protein kinase/Flp pilus assembly protein TadD